MGGSVTLALVHPKGGSVDLWMMGGSLIDLVGEGDVSSPVGVCADSFVDSFLAGAPSAHTRGLTPP